MVKENTRHENKSNKDSERISNLVVHNDDINTFEYVIDTLVDVCKHDPVQAEQCTWIIHHKGKCVVKSGDREALMSMRKQIHERNIKATVE